MNKDSLFAQVRVLYSLVVTTYISRVFPMACLEVIVHCPSGFTSKPYLRTKFLSPDFFMTWFTLLLFLCLMCPDNLCLLCVKQIKLALPAVLSQQFTVTYSGIL